MREEEVTVKPMNTQFWASEYGMDCFGMGHLGEEEGGSVPNQEIPGSWFPFYVDGKQVGWVQLAMERYTTVFGVKAMEGHTVEVKVEGIQHNGEG